MDQYSREFIAEKARLRPEDRELGTDTPQALLFNPDFHFSFGSANHRVVSDAFIYAGLKALKALRRSTPNG